MPRAERPLESDGGVLAEFAAGLRLLRQKAGSPTYRELSRRTHYSSSTLADAASGKRLPSLAVTSAYVRACGGDPVEWEARWHATAGELAVHEPGPASGADDARCPYVGLAAFRPEDAGFFFGREELTADLVARVRRARFLAVFGASGTGKSSLLRAGLLPALRAGEPAGAGTVPVLLFTPGPHPLEECAARLAALVGGSAPTLHGQLRDDPRALHLTVLQALSEPSAADDLVLIVDQFEETFTLCADRSERDQFVALLLAAARAPNSRARIVLGVRADFYAHCADHPELVEAMRDATLLVGPMGTDELRRAVSLPAARVGCSVDGALLARVIADAAGQVNALPLVSHALRETWSRRRGHALSVQGYEAAGGIRHALANTAEHVYQGLPPERQRLARTILLRLVALGEGTGDTRRRVDRDEFDDGDTTAVLESLARARLITLDTRTVELTHEALLQAWPRLRGWINEDRAGLVVHQQLVDAAGAWDREGRDPGALYRGARLAGARQWAAGHPDQVGSGARVQEFLAASVRQERRAGRLRAAAIAALCVLTVLATLAALGAWRQRSAALTQRDRAVAARLTVQTQTVAGTDVSLAAQLDLAAYRISPSAERYTHLLDTENTALSTVLTGHTDVVYAVAYRRDGRVLATGGRDGTVRLWDVADPSRPTALGRPLDAHADRVYWLAFSPDGRTLAAAQRDRTVRLWNVTDPVRPRPWGPPLTGHTDYVFSVAFSPDGHTLVSAGQDRTVRLWNVTDPARPRPWSLPLTGHTAPVASAVYSPDGRSVASLGHDRTVRLWNVTDPAHPALWCPPLTGHTSIVFAAAFSPDSRLLATVGDDRTVRLWDVADPAHATAFGSPLTGHTDSVYAVAFSPDGHLLATAGADQAVRLWNVTDPAHPVPFGVPLTGHTGYVYWAAFSPDGRTLATASADGTTRLWNLPATTLPTPGPATAGAFSRRGHLLAVADGDGGVRLADLTDPTRPAWLGTIPTGHTGTVDAVAFGPDGRLLATAGADGTVRLWDLTDPARPAGLGRPLTGHTGAVDAVAFSPDGRLLATAGADRTVLLWDLTDRAHPAVQPPLPTGHTKEVDALAFAPTGRLLVTGSADDSLRRWDLTRPDHPAPVGPPLDTRSNGVRALAFSPDGHTLAGASADHTVRLWDLADPARPVARVPALAGHTGIALAVAFSPDGRTLASGGQDQTVRLWDLTDPAHPLALGEPLTDHTGRVRWVGFSPDGRALVSAGDDRTVQITPLRVGSAVRRICAGTGDPLTRPVWERYAPELPFTPPCRQT